MMRLRSLLICATLALAGFSQDALAESWQGLWRTAKDDNGYSGVIQLSRCGDKLCGRLVRSYNDKNEVFVSEYDGKNIITETVKVGNGEYRGRAFSPDRGKTYNARMRMNGNKLNVRGCIFGICRDGGTWTRIK